MANLLRRSDLSQRFAMPNGMTKALLTDIGTEELAHLEIVGTLVERSAKNASDKEIAASPVRRLFHESRKVSLSG